VCFPSPEPDDLIGKRVSLPFRVAEASSTWWVQSVGTLPIDWNHRVCVVAISVGLTAPSRPMTRRKPAF
jgi:hypothetical protein